MNACAAGAGENACVAGAGIVSEVGVTCRAARVWEAPADIAKGGGAGARRIVEVGLAAESANG